VKEGSAFLIALLLAAGIAYWSDHYRLGGWDARSPVAEPAFPPASSTAARPSSAIERLEVSGATDAAGKAALCEELQEVILGVDAALLSPQSPAAAEQLAARRRVYAEKRLALGCGVPAN
jgi:hypothetical protein